MGTDRVKELEIKVEVLTTELEHNKTSLELQAKEYERRLSELNASHSLLTERMWKLTIALISAVGALAAKYFIK